MLWANGPVADDVKEGHVFLHEHPFNVGQHVAHNEMLDEANRAGYRFHTRVDDDCWLTTKHAFNRLHSLSDFMKDRGVFGIEVRGLNHPPRGIANPLKWGREKLQQVDILGGIFRMAPMGLMRYFRWEERLPMGFGEARQFANYCTAIAVPLYRIESIRCSHGDSTNKQQENKEWEYEHDMLQNIPLGL